MWSLKGFLLCFSEAVLGGLPVRLVTNLSKSLRPGESRTLRSQFTYAPALPSATTLLVVRDSHDIRSY
jgi:hypothetical protein